MADSIEIDRAQAVLLLEEVVEERGAGFVYVHPAKATRLSDGSLGLPNTGCWYEVNGAPSCGVGVALHKAGVPIEVLDAMDQVDGDSSIGEVDQILESYGVTLTHGALAAFTTFQSHQDLDTPWGEALDLVRESNATKEN